MRQLEPANLGLKHSVLLVIKVLLSQTRSASYRLDSSLTAQGKWLGPIAKYIHLPDNADLLHSAIDA